jgi:hypothetical protein
MPPDFFGILGRFSPEWALALLVAGILCWRSPQIIREIRRRRP